jgi:hypothetical protein
MESIKNMQQPTICTTSPYLSCLALSTFLDLFSMVSVFNKLWIGETVHQNKTVVTRGVALQKTPSMY